MESKKKKHLLTIAMASLIIVSSLSASIMSGCQFKKSPESTDSTIKTTEVVTEIIENTYFVDDNGNKIVIDENGKEVAVDDNGNVLYEVSDVEPDEKNENDNSSSASSQTSSNSSNSQNSEKTESSNSSQSSKPASSKNESSKTESSSSNKKPNNSSNALSIDGNKFSVGDTVTCTYKLTAPEVLENYQGEIYYNPEYLTVKSARLLSPANSGGILNFKIKGEIKFNGSNISGAYDFTNGGDLLVVTYEVKASGSTNVTDKWVAVTGVSQKAYVTGDKLSNGAKITKTYSK